MQRKVSQGYMPRVCDILRQVDAFANLFFIMRVHIFDPQLNLVDGHYANYDAAVIAELQRRGIETVVYGSARSVSTANSNLSAKPIFSRDIFDEIGRDPVTWALENFVELGAEFYSDLASVDPSGFAKSDVAFFPNIVHNQIDAVREWVVRLPDDRRPSIVLKLSYLVHAMPFIQQRRNKEMIPILFRFVMRRITANHPRTWLCSDTEEMVKQFGEISEVPIHLLPLPLVIKDTGGQSNRDATIMRVAYLGHTSMLKGAHLLPEIVQRVWADGNGPHFLIQLFANAQLCASLKEAFAKTPPGAVTLVDNAVDAATYRKFLNEADIVLLPYAREFYGWASSGIFTEALSIGKVVVVPEGTWLARQVEKFHAGGVIFSAFNAKSIAEAVQRAVRSLPQLTQLASTAAPEWTTYHSPRRFVDTMLSLTS